MFLTQKRFISSDIAILDFFRDNRSKIIELANKHFAEEEIRDTGSQLNKILLYYLAMYYGMIMYEDYTRKNYSCGSLKKKWNFEKINECFKCQGINLDDVLTSLGIVQEELKDSGGIGDNQIGKSFIVWPFDFQAESVTPQYTTEEIKNMINNKTIINTLY